MPVAEGFAALPVKLILPLVWIVVILPPITLFMSIPSPPVRLVLFPTMLIVPLVEEIFPPKIGIFMPLLPVLLVLPFRVMEPDPLLICVFNPLILIPVDEVLFPIRVMEPDPLVICVLKLPILIPALPKVELLPIRLILPAPDVRLPLTDNCPAPLI